MPRPGTISPWSSKATDIVHNSGLATVKRIERGTAYYINGGIAANRSAIAGLLHDRMTETVLQSLDAAKILFETGEPAELQTIDMLESGKEALAKANQKLGLALADDEIDYLYDAYTVSSVIPPTWS